MNRIVHTINLIILAAFMSSSTVIFACGSSESTIPEEPKLTKLDTLSLIDDPNFANGIILARQVGESPGNLYPYGSNNKKPTWKIAEWGTKYWLSDQNRTEKDGAIVYQNEGKYIELRKK